MLSDLMARQAKATGKPYSLADFDGLYLYVSAIGSKVWHFRYSWLGKRERITFGGYPALPALHGGAIGAFLEITAIMELAWAQVWERMEGGGAAAAEIEAGRFPALPKTIDFTIDYLRAGLPRDAYARARVNRVGRRYASVHVEAWQDNRARPMAQATGHFLMPEVG